MVTTGPAIDGKRSLATAVKPIAIVSGVLVVGTALFLAPGSWPVRLLVVYLGVGIIGAVGLFAKLFALIVQHNRWGQTLRLIAPYILRERSSFLVAVSLLLFVLCYGYNFVILWPVLFLPRILPPRRRSQKGNQSAYQALAQANRHPGFAIDYFLWPTAAAIAVVALYAASYCGLDLPYAALTTVLWIGAIARLVYYTLPNFSPANEDVPTFMRRRYHKPRLMYLLLLAIEGVGLVLTLPIVILRLPPAMVTVAQHKLVFASFYRPSDWLTMLTAWPPTRQAWIANGSGLLFDSALLAYLFRCLMFINLFGWDDPFRTTDGDHLRLAENALRANDFNEAAAQLDRLSSHSETSYRLGALLDLAGRDIRQASIKIAKRRDLLRQRSDAASVFHELLSSSQTHGDPMEGEIIGWAMDSRVSDEDIAHALLASDSEARGVTWVTVALEMLRMFSPGARVEPHASLRVLAKTHPLTTAVILVRALPDFTDSELTQEIQAALKGEARNAHDGTPLRQALVGYLSGDHTVGGLDTLIRVVDDLVRTGRDEDEVARVLTYVMSLTKYIATRGDQTHNVNALRNRWKTITAAVKAHQKYSHQLHFIMKDIASMLKQIPSV